MTKKLFTQKLEQMTDQIVRDHHPDKVILFGSWAWGTPGPDSDVDLLIIKKTDDIRKTAREIDGSIFPRPFPVDLIVYSPSQIEKQQKKDFFIRTVLTKGRVLYEKQ